MIERAGSTGCSILVTWASVNMICRLRSGIWWRKRGREDDDIIVMMVEGEHGAWQGVGEIDIH